MPVIRLPRTVHDLPWQNHQPNPVIDDGVLRVTCNECGERFSKKLAFGEQGKVSAFYENNGYHPDGHVQDVFPAWSVADRELFLMSHLCQRCWDKLMSPPDEEER